MSSILNSYFGLSAPPSSHSVALFAGDREVAARGYARQYVERGAWDIRAGVARATVRFGPFEEPVSFTGSRIFAGRELVSVADDGPVTLRAGMGYELAVEVRVG